MPNKSITAQIGDAIREKDLTQLRDLIINNPEQINTHTYMGGQTWLGYAASEGRVDVVNLLVELGFDINLGSKHDNKNPICCAADSDHIDVVAYLLSRGAVLDTSLSIRNPLFAAIVGRSSEIVRLLLEAGIDSKVRYDSKTMKNMDAVAFARMQGELGCARMIALWNADGDEALAKEAFIEAERIAYENA